MTGPDPFWMSNSNWYRMDMQTLTWVLTDDAPEEARADYERWMKEREEFGMKGA